MTGGNRKRSSFSDSNMSAELIEAEVSPWCGPCDKSRRKFLARTQEWLIQHMHWKRRDQQSHLGDAARLLPVLRLHHCQPKLDWVRREVQRQWARTLRQQSQRHRLYWSYLASPWFKLPLPPRHSLHPTV